MNSALVSLAALPLLAGAGYAATADTAERQAMVQATDTVPPLTARDVCNGLVYYSYRVEEARICYRAVAAERGWLPQTIDVWQPFVVDETDSSILAGESAYCWNMRRGDLVNIGAPCTEKWHWRGNQEDSGWGAATYVWYNPSTGPLCLGYGYCSGAEIVASPYDSMLASVILLIELDGSGPWCFTRPWNSIGYHDCWEAPDR